MSNVRRADSCNKDSPVPATGSRWIWEQGQPDAQEIITVTRTEWNGEEWWVETVADDRPREGFVTSVISGKPYWNDLSRFWEAVSLIPAGGVAGERGVTGG